MENISSIFYDTTAAILCFSFYLHCSVVLTWCRILIISRKKKPTTQRRAGAGALSSYLQS